MIQQLHVTDAPWLAALHRQAFEKPWSAVSFAEILALPTTLGWALMPETTPRPVGFILLQAQGQEGEILTFQVAADHQGRGYGRALLTQGVTVARQLNLEHLFLEVAVSRRRAQKVYQAQGFRVSRRRKNYYRGQNGPEDALVMQLLLRAELS